MIFSVSVVNYTGDVLTIDLRHPEQSGFVIRSIDGLGPVKANINTTAVTTGDGSVYNSARLNERNIVFNISPIDGVIEGETEYSSVEDNRLKLYKYFPLKQKVTLYFQTENRFAYIEGYTETNDPSIFSQEVIQTVSVICPYPYFYDASDKGTATTSFAGVDAWFEFPTEPLSDDRDFNDMSDTMVEFGQIIAKKSNNVPYYGDANVGIIMRLHAIGTVENIRIYNVNTRERMIIDTDKLEALTGYKMIAADDIIISTLQGEKSITLYRNGEYVNILSCLNRGADWFQLSKGDNVFMFAAESGESNLQFTVTNQVIFEGI